MTKQQNPNDVMVPALTAGEWRGRLTWADLAGDAFREGEDSTARDDAPIDTYEWVYTTIFRGYGFEFKIGHNLATRRTHATWAPRLPNEVDWSLPRRDGAPTLGELFNDLREAFLMGVYRDEHASLREPDKSTVEPGPLCEGPR
jgi:hypothetical protein